MVYNIVLLYSFSSQMHLIQMTWYLLIYIATPLYTITTLIYDIQISHPLCFLTELNTNIIQEPRVETRKWRKLLWGEGPYLQWWLLGKRFRFAYNEHCGEDPKQIEFKSLCHKYYSTIRL